MDLLANKNNIKLNINNDNGDQIKIYTKDRTCRTCLSNIIKDNHKINEQKITNYQEHFELLQLKVIMTNDDLPQQICQLCVTKLKEIKLFYLTSQQSQLILVEFFNKPMSSADKLHLIKKQPVSKITNTSTKLIKQLDLLPSPPPPPPAEFDSKISELKPVEECDLINNKKLTNDFLLNCNSCGKTFNNKLDLKQHLNEHLHGGYKKNCNKCGEQFTKLKAFQHHYIKRNCVPSINPTCRICNKVFVNGISALENHLAQYHPLGKLSITCCFCKKTFKTAYNFNKHMNLHKDIKLTADANKLTEISTLVPIIANDEMMVKRECPHCGDNFNTLDKYKYHIRQHKFGSRPFLCDICAKGFITKSQLKLHMFSHMGIKPYSCTLCDKKYAYNHSLVIHMRLHTGERPFKCDQCGQDFADKELLKYHVAKHKGIIKRKNNIKSTVGKLDNKRSYPYCCHLCSRSFKLPSSLSKHMKIHNEIRKFICTHCGNGFKLATTLRIHVNSVHLKLKPYKCDHCDKTFSQTGDRNLHMRLHSGEKPYECSYCKKRFQIERVLRVHLRLHTGEKPYKCDFCNMDFMTYKSLAKHSNIHEINRDELFMRTE